MNVLYITYDGALDFVCRSQAIPYLKGLSEKDHKITILSFEKKAKFNNRCLLDGYSELLKKSGIDWIRKIYHKKPALPATLFDIMQGLAAGHSIMKRAGIGLVHARGYVAALIGAILKYRFKAKLIFDMRGFWPDEKVDAGAWRKNGLLYRFMKKVEAFLVERADEVVVLTSSAKEILTKKYKINGNTTVIPCCVDTELFNMVQDRYCARAINNIEKKPVFFYAGSLGSFYSLNAILDFFDLAKRQGRPFYLWLASDYSKERILTEIRRRNIDADDYRLESIDYRDMPQAFSRADASIIFYNRRLSGRGCCPIKLGESLACGRPVIINSGIGDCDDLIAENRIGVVIKDFSEGEYSKAIDSLATLMNDRSSLARRCREAAEKFLSLRDGIERYDAVYVRLGR